MHVSKFKIPGYRWYNAEQACFYRFGTWRVIMRIPEHYTIGVFAIIHIINTKRPARMVFFVVLRRALLDPKMVGRLGHHSRSRSVHCNPDPPPAGGRQRRAQPHSAPVVVCHRGFYYLHDCVLRSRWKNCAMVASNGSGATVGTSSGFEQRTRRRRCESVSR